MELKDFFEFKWKYLPGFLYGKIFKRNTPQKRYLFITHEGTKGWILEAKAKRLSSNCPLESEVYYTNNYKNIPDAEGYFFLHQKIFARTLRYNPHIRYRKCIVMFTHPNWNKYYSARHIAYTLRFAHKIICLNQAVANELISLGTDKEKIEIYHMASNPDMFQPRERTGDGSIGFCMGYYERKNPNLVIEIVKGMPDKKFILLGRDWNKYEHFNDLLAMKNFTYYEDLPYEQFAALYQQMDVFVSTSFLEGGPVPLLESMLCNVVPVCSRTGFCPDIIEDGINGYLFNAKDPASHVIDLIRKAFDIKINVRDKVEMHSWENYGNKIGGLFNSIIN